MRAAGGVIWRRRGEGTDQLEVVLVHRPRYDDWTLPKGKVEPSETDEEAAVREVIEETKVRPRLGPELATTSYVDSAGRPKIVRYWAMTPSEGSGEPDGDHEVDDARWVSIDEARRLISYERDLAVVDSLSDVLR